MPSYTRKFINYVGGLLFKTTAKATIFTVKTAGKTTLSVAGTAIRHRRKIGHAVVTTAAVTSGAMVGTAKAAYHTVQDGHALATIKDEEINDLGQRIRKQSQEYTKLVSKHQSLRDKKDLALDTLVVGGNTLAYYMTHPVPEDIERAFALQYPGLASHESFAEAVQETNAANLVGFISGVKGKLFELQYVEYLNAGNLPTGYVAKLADSPTQPGWDFQVIGPDGHIADQIQLKATQSVEYVKQALEKYPGIDVVSTSEVHSHLVMQGLSEHVTDGHISDAALTTAVTSAANDTVIHMHYMPSVVALALIAYSSYSRKGLSMYQKARLFGERSGKSYFSYLVGGGLAVVLQIWWISVVAAIGSRLLLGQGRKKRERRDALNERVKMNEIVLDRLRAFP